MKETIIYHQPDKGNQGHGAPPWGDAIRSHHERRLPIGRERLTPQRLEEIRRAREAFLTLPDGSTRPIGELLLQVNPDKNMAFAAKTGSGKTLTIPVSLLLADQAHIPPRRVLVVQPTRQLCANVSDTLQALYGSDIVGHHFGGMQGERKKILMLRC